jgi:hypothetical protein
MVPNKLSQVATGGAVLGRDSPSTNSPLVIHLFRNLLKARHRRIVRKLTTTWVRVPVTVWMAALFRKAIRRWASIITRKTSE